MEVLLPILLAVPHFQQLFFSLSLMQINQLNKVYKKIRF